MFFFFRRRIFPKLFTLCEFTFYLYLYNFDETIGSKESLRWWSRQRFPPCSLGLSATSQQYFSLTTNQPPATSQQYFSLRTNQHQPSATSQTNRLEEDAEGICSLFKIDCCKEFLVVALIC
jgi:hypothetical protein